MSIPNIGSVGRNCDSALVKKLFTLVILFLSSSAFAAGTSGNTYEFAARYKSGELRGLIVHKVPVPLPRLNFLDRAGSNVPLNKFAGKVVILNLWATWCSPCVKELPSLEALQKQLEPDGVKIVAVSQDRAAEEVVPPFLTKLKLKRVTVLLDSKADAMKNFRATALPTTLFIDRSGKEVARLTGAIDWSSKDVVKFALFLNDEK